jgi:hypothetical protein
MRPTPYPDLNAVLADLANGIRGVLGDDLVGFCLQGSFAVGDFDDWSDVDYVVAIREPLSDGQVDALRVVHGGVYDLPNLWAQHLEGSYFPLDVLRDWRRRGEPLWYQDNGSRVLVRESHCNTAVVRQQVRAHGVALHGPDPATLVDPIPVDVLRAEIRDVIVNWGADILAKPEAFENRFYQGFIVLSFCRKWCDLIKGSVGSKRRGAEWAKERLDPEWHDLIDRAWETRPVPEVSVRTPPDPDDWSRTLRLVARIVDRVKSSRA